MAEIEVVLFDYGGVLADEGFSHTLEGLARGQRLAVADMTAEGAQAVYDSGYVLGRGSEADFWALLRKRTGLQGDDAALTAAVLKAFVLRPWMLAWVSRLREAGYLTAILSDQTDWLDRLEARDIFFHGFDRVFNSYYLGKGKRDQTLFTDVAGALGVAPASMLFIDDNAGHIQRAAQAGLQVIHYQDRDGFEQALTDRLGLTPPVEEDADPAVPRKGRRA